MRWGCRPIAQSFVSPGKDLGLLPGAWGALWWVKHRGSMNKLAFRETCLGDGVEEGAKGTKSRHSRGSWGLM